MDPSQIPRHTVDVVGNDSISFFRHLPVFSWTLFFFRSPRKLNEEEKVMEREKDCLQLIMMKASKEFQCQKKADTWEFVFWVLKKIEKVYIVVARIFMVVCSGLACLLFWRPEVLFSVFLTFAHPWVNVVSKFIGVNKHEYENSPII